MNGDWGLGIGDWGLGIGDWAQSPIPNPHPPPYKNIKYIYHLLKYIFSYLYLLKIIKII